MRIGQHRIVLASVCVPVAVAINGCGQSTAQQVERGRVLVIAAGCNDCHTTKKAGPQGPEPDMSRMLSGHPEQVKISAAVQAGRRQSVDGRNHRRTDRVEWPVGRLVCRQPDARSEYRSGHLDRSHVRQGAQDR